MAGESIPHDRGWAVPPRCDTSESTPIPRPTVVRQSSHDTLLSERSNASEWSSTGDKSPARQHVRSLSIVRFASLQSTCSTDASRFVTTWCTAADPPTRWRNRALETSSAALAHHCERTQARISRQTNRNVWHSRTPPNKHMHTQLHAITHKHTRTHHTFTRIQ